MKFEIADEDVKVLEGKFVQLPFDRFAELIDYVEDVEARLLAAEINLREADRVGHEMEVVVSENAPENGRENPSEADLRDVNRVLQRLEPAQLKKAVEAQGISVRKLAMMTGIPYATLYRYLRAPSCPMKAATNIFLTLNKMLKKPLGAVPAGLQRSQTLKSR
jgi:lambda repressor-like predicted transcriptional regulator